MDKVLEAFDRIEQEVDGCLCVYHIEENDIDIVKQSLLKTQSLEKENAEYKKILKIIKNKSVNMIRLEAVLMYNGKAADYNKDEEYEERHLIDEEFDTLKMFCLKEDKRSE